MSKALAYGYAVLGLGGGGPTPAVGSFLQGRHTGTMGVNKVKNLGGAPVAFEDVEAFDYFSDVEGSGPQMCRFVQLSNYLELVDSRFMPIEHADSRKGAADTCGQLPGKIMDKKDIDFVEKCVKGMSWLALVFNKEKTGLVFGGDLGTRADRELKTDGSDKMQSHSLRIMHLLANLKKRCPDRVVLLLGNRDLLQMRFYHEMLGAVWTDIAVKKRLDATSLQQKAGFGSVLWNSSGRPGYAAYSVSEVGRKGAPTKGLYIEDFLKTVGKVKKANLENLAKDQKAVFPETNIPAGKAKALLDEWKKIEADYPAPKGYRKNKAHATAVRLVRSVEWLTRTEMASAGDLAHRCNELALLRVTNPADFCPVDKKTNKPRLIADDGRKVTGWVHAAWSYLEQVSACADPAEGVYKEGKEQLRAALNIEGGADVRAEAPPGDPQTWLEVDTFCDILKHGQLVFYHEQTKTLITHGQPIFPSGDSLVGWVPRSEPDRKKPDSWNMYAGRQEELGPNVVPALGTPDRAVEKNLFLQKHQLLGVASWAAAVNAFKAREMRNFLSGRTPLKGKGIMTGDAILDYALLQLPGGALMWMGHPRHPLSTSYPAAAGVMTPPQFASTAAQPLITDLGMVDEHSQKFFEDVRSVIYGHQPGGLSPAMYALKRPSDPVSGLPQHPLLTVNADVSILGHPAWPRDHTMTCVTVDSKNPRLEGMGGFITMIRVKGSFRAEPQWLSPTYSNEFREFRFPAGDFGVSVDYDFFVGPDVSGFIPGPSGGCWETVCPLLFASDYVDAEKKAPTLRWIEGKPIQQYAGVTEEGKDWQNAWLIPRGLMHQRTPGHPSTAGMMYVKGPVGLPAPNYKSYFDPNPAPTSDPEPATTPKRQDVPKELGGGGGDGIVAGSGDGIVVDKPTEKEEGCCADCCER